MSEDGQPVVVMVQQPQQPPNNPQPNNGGGLAKCANRMLLLCVIIWALVLPAAAGYYVMVWWLDVYEYEYARFGNWTPSNHTNSNSSSSSTFNSTQNGTNPEGSEKQHQVQLKSFLQYNRSNRTRPSTEFLNKFGLGGIFGSNSNREEVQVNKVEPYYENTKKYHNLHL